MDKKVRMCIFAAVLAATGVQAEVVTVEGRVARARNGSEMEIVNPSISVMDNKIFATIGLQPQLEAYEGKTVRITGDLGKRPAGYSLFKTIDSIEEIGDQP